MKILINRKPVNGPWGGGNNFVKALHEYSSMHGFTPVNTFSEDIDLIFMVDPRYDELGISLNEIAAYKQYRPSTKIVYRINECDKRKGLVNDIDPLIRSVSNVSDMCIFISDWIKDYHISEGWGCPRNWVIYSGTNKDHFISRPDDRIKNGKINIVTHHWSDNPFKGLDIYQQLGKWIEDNPEYTFTYIGRSQSAIANTNMIPPTFGSDLGKKLSRHDVYVSASRFDPGPNHIIESLACNIPTYAYIEGGGACEMVGPQHVYTDFSHLTRMLLEKNFRSNHGLVPLNWEECIAQYFEKILELFE